jgi:hypothetical protein
MSHWTCSSGWFFHKSFLSGICPEIEIPGKPCIIALFLLFFVMQIPALNVRLAPLFYIDETRDTVYDQSRIHWDLLRRLRTIETGGALHFSLPGNDRVRPPQSLLDAVSLCREDRADYLLYGYIAKKDYTLYGEIKLFDYGNRTILRIFYAADDHANQERLLANLAEKIAAYIDEAFHLNIGDPGPDYWELWALAGAGYWTPLDGAWIDLLTGTGLVTGGVRFVPRDRLFTAFGKAFYVSASAELGYRLGAGGVYGAWDHSLSAGGPVRLHLELDRKQQLFAGLGLLYSLDFMTVQEPYKDRETKIYNTLGLVCSLGYAFKVDGRFAFFFDSRIEARFYKTPMITYSPRLGIEWLLVKREAARKW